MMLDIYAFTMFDAPPPRDDDLRQCSRFCAADAFFRLPRARFRVSAAAFSAASYGRTRSFTSLRLRLICLIAA